MTGRAKQNQAGQFDPATAADIRLSCLKLTDPKTTAADVDQWVSRAKRLEESVTGIGQAPVAPKYKPGAKTQKDGDKAQAPMSFEA